MDGAEIRRLREARGMTQPELAKVLRVGPRTIGNWETGATVPKNRLGMLREFFGVDERQADDPLRNVSDADLAAEVTRRLLSRSRAAAGQGH